MRLTRKRRIEIRHAAYDEPFFVLVTLPPASDALQIAAAMDQYVAVVSADEIDHEAASRHLHDCASACAPWIDAIEAEDGSPVECGAGRLWQDLTPEERCSAALEYADVLTWGVGVELRKGAAPTIAAKCTALQGSAKVDGAPR